MKLRSTVFDEQAKEKMIVEYMHLELAAREALIYGKACGNDEASQMANRYASKVAALKEITNRTEVNEALGEMAGQTERYAKQVLQNEMYDIRGITEKLQKRFKVKLSKEDFLYVHNQLLQFDVQLSKAEQVARLQADWAPLQLLRADVGNKQALLSKRYHLRDIIKAYLDSFDTDPEKKGIQLNSWRAVKRQVTFIEDTFGNAELTVINSKKGKEKLQTALSQKRKSTGETISSKESSEYMKRLSTLVKFVIDENELDITNRITGTFKSFGSEKPRDSFNHTNIRNLVIALCTVQIVAGRGRMPRNDRFWIILIALLHGFRKSSIVNLQFRHIVADDDTGILCFDLRNDSALLHTKTDSMKILCPVHPALISLGFMEWIDSRNLTKAEKLFEDDPNSFGQWFNGVTNTSGWNYDHITQEDKKTFHSFRHYFRMLGRDLGLSDKEIDEMSGHARHTKGSIGTKHYDERTQAQRFSDIQARMMEEGRFLRKDVDFDRLKVRATELFFADAVI